jgi:1-acyl-sn-glycerol-3-phosphate acyltransferase
MMLERTLRSALCVVAVFLNTVLCAVALLLAAPLPYRTRYRVIDGWCRFALLMLERVCGLRYRVLGAEHLPKEAAVVLSKHQSAWETIALPQLLPLQTWVIKRELLWVPFFGWGLACARPIAINRAQRSKATRQLIEQGAARLRDGIWIVVFPEGTRVRAGEKGQYKHGGARLACGAGVPVVPVAVNSGEFWPRNSFIKHPGEITLSIGPAIDTTGKTPEQVTREAEYWIEQEMARISGVGPCWPHAQSATVHASATGARSA